MHRDRGSRGPGRAGRSGGSMVSIVSWSVDCDRAFCGRSGGKKTCGFGRDKRKKKPKRFCSPNDWCVFLYVRSLPGFTLAPKDFWVCNDGVGSFDTILATTTRKRYKTRIVERRPGCCAHCFMAVGHRATLVNYENTRGVVFESESVYSGTNVMKTSIHSDRYVRFFHV